MGPTGGARGDPPLARRALFVDRDGTLIPDLHYLKDAERLELFAGVTEALIRARQHGELVVCVTNQSGIERGLYTTGDVERIHARLNELLGRSGARVDAFYFCPHVPERGCRCRKPGTELFERAARDLHLDLATSVFVGDRRVDVEAGRRLGIVTALVRTPGHEAAVDRELSDAGLRADLVADSFLSAVERLLAWS
ncbi:MAG TPA: HAD family hydrolase [Thermoplasmata archaeon]|nr:HAD family hydrolase [Thermoplasmata archaeon]